MLWIIHQPRVYLSPCNRSVRALLFIVEEVQLIDPCSVVKGTEWSDRLVNTIKGFTPSYWSGANSPLLSVLSLKVHNTFSVDRHTTLPSAGATLSFDYFWAHPSSSGEKNHVCFTPIIQSVLLCPLLQNISRSDHFQFHRRNWLENKREQQEILICLKHSFQI